MYHRAQPLLEGVLLAFTRALPCDSPVVLDALCNLAACFRCKGDHHRALCLYQQVALLPKH
jgi:hypothetical protein